MKSPSFLLLGFHGVLRSRVWLVKKELDPGGL